MREILFIFTISFLSESYFCKESYIILPRSLKFCQENRNIRLLTMTKQISLNFNGVQSLTDLYGKHSIKFVCSVIVKPLGRRISLNYNRGTVNFWKLRFSMNMKLSCSSTLTMHFLKDDHIYEPSSEIHELISENKSMAFNYNCNQHIPISMNVNSSNLLIFWTADSSIPLDSEFLDIQLSTYMSFDGNFTKEQRERYCILQYGFWCGAGVEVCINAQMRCDQADGCFDGGSDEYGCPLPRNVTQKSELNSRPQKDSWSSYLPWIVLGILPLILIFSLVLICNQRRPGLDSVSSENEDAAERDVKDELSYIQGERRNNNSVDYVGGNEEFSIRYGGRIHRLSGDPRDNNSLNSSESNIEWNETTQYLPQNSPDYNSSSYNDHNEIKSNSLNINNDPVQELPITVSKETKPKLYYKIGEASGEISPTLTNKSSLNENSPAGMRSQMSVVTYCGSERSCGMIRSPSVEEIMMKELIAEDSTEAQNSNDSFNKLDKEGFCTTKIEVIHC